MDNKKSQQDFVFAVAVGLASGLALKIIDTFIAILLSILGL